MNILPRWVDAGLIPLLNLLLAFAVAALVVAVIGENPLEALRLLLNGALGSSYGIGYTLYYATTFAFTGLAVAVAFHASLFNIGGEGQALMAGLGAALVALTLDWAHWALVLPLSMIGAVLAGALWAALPAWLQARRGSHIVITTIMFNYIAYSVIGWFLDDILKPAGSMAPETRKFAESAHMPFMHDLLAPFGVKLANTPLNLSFVFALVAAVLVWLLIWRTRFGYDLRAYGHSRGAARYAGINATRITMVAMIVSGALAGMVALNVVLGGYSHKLVGDPVQGAGFVGIAVALMGRSHPVGVCLAALLFGILYQGGAELAYDMPAISRDMIIVIQALVILFTGALENLVRMPMIRLWLLIGGRG